MHKETKIIGIFGANLFNQQPLQFIQELKKACENSGYCITALCSSSNSVERYSDNIGDTQLIELIRYIPFAGIVLFTETIKRDELLQRLSEICREKHIPVFSIDGSVEGCYNMEFDNSTGFEAMVRHIVEEHGCRRVNMLAGLRNNYFSDERIKIYKKVLKENNIPIEKERIGYGDFWELPAREVVRNFLNSSLPLPEAIICANDSMAIAVCSELCAAGFEIPKDILVTGFDGIQNGQYHVPVLTTCKPDFAEASRFIIDELKRIAVNGNFEPYAHPITYIPMMQQSCGCEPTTFYNLNHIISSLYAQNGDSAWHNIAMNEMITANLNNDSITQLAEILPHYVKLWNDHFHFVCVKAGMQDSYEVPESITDMVTLLYAMDHHFMPYGNTFTMKDLIPYIGRLFKDNEILIVHILKSGKTVYGFNVESYDNIDQRKMQRCNDFSFFLSYCLDTILHNARKKELTSSLIKANLEVSMMALQDSMTGLYNRQGFFKEIEPLIAMDYNVGKYLYIFSIDMNGLKYINDTFGHADGDFALTTLAHAINHTMGDAGICARFGGDEFVAAAISEEESAYSVSEFSKRLTHNIDISDGISDKSYPVRASVGMNCLPITHSMNLESMIATADESMYEMKRKEKKESSS